MKIKTKPLQWKLMPIFLLMYSLTFGQTLIEKKQISSSYNQNYLLQLQSEYAQKAKEAKQKALAMAAQKGWDVLKHNEDGTFDELIAVSSDGQPIYLTLFNANAAKSTRVNHLHTGGTLGLDVNGQNMTAHVWDGGPVRPTHQEFDGAGGSNRVNINDGVTTLNSNSFHSQHVTGTIVASGYVSAAKGMAPYAQALTHEWNNDLSEATAEAANGMLVSNHSYGYQAYLIPDWYFGAYIDESANWDNLMYNSPYYLMVVAAGNDGDDNSSNGSPLDGYSSYDKLSAYATCKNNVVVANGQDANVNTDGSLNSVFINSSSSEGPTDDYRIKPDITGNGTSVYSTYDGSDSEYNTISGTSMATPNVTGTLLILQQYYNQVNGSFMRSSTLKGLALHTADDAGTTGPDAIYGWGLLNAKEAANTIANNGSTSIVDELTLSSGQSYSITVQSDGTNPLIASICWTDPAGPENTGTTNLTTPVLVNDLDIRITQSSTTFTPWRLTGVTTNGTGDNTVDPFERIDINGAGGTYTITVSHKGSLSGASQNYALIVTGLGGSVSCDATTPTGLTVSSVSASSATLLWNSVAGASYEVRYRQTGTTTWTTVSTGSITSTLSGLAATTNYEAQVRSICPDGATSDYSSSVTFTTTQVQLDYCSSNGNDVSDEFIQLVSLGSINNATGASSSGYADYTSISTDIGQGSTYTLTVTPEWTGTVYSEGYSVWIDYNQDGDFEDTGEQVWTLSATKTTPVSGTFTVPTEASAGATRMRVSMKYNGIPTACESFSYGEVEDYTVNITTGGGSNSGTGCSGGITSYPYSESFESSFGLWTNVTGDDLDWTRYSGSTPSSSTGPTSASDGSYYIYSEVSGSGYPSKRAILNSPCFDLSSMTNAYLSFKYHMYGASTMGSLTVEVSKDNGVTWTSVWTKSGNQGDSWYSANIDLAGYLGESIIIRLNTISGDTWQGDVAVDNISLANTAVLVDICEGIDAWSSSNTYAVGDLVTYQGYLFERTSSGWVQIGACGTSTNAFTMNSDETSIVSIPGSEDVIFTASIYPNPVINGNLNIAVNKENIDYKITNLMGQQILSGKLQSNSIDANKLPNGIYFIEFIAGNDTLRLRFIKK